MSRTVLYKVLPNGDVEWYADFQNSYRGAFLIWRNMGEKYLGDERYLDTANFKKYFSSTKYDDYDEDVFWDLVGQKSVPIQDRIALASTYDFIVIKKENLPRLIEAFEFYSNNHDDPGHIPQQIEKIQELLNEDILGICWNQTDTSADVWTEQYDEYEDEDNGIPDYDTGRPFNIFKDDHWGNKHSFLFGKEYINDPPLDNLEEVVIQK